MSQTADYSSLHVAMIMDGNGRWATRKGMPRVSGHKAGAKTAKNIIESCREMGVGTLTLYAFSSDNWKRPNFEVNTLMKLFVSYLKTETQRCLRNQIKLSIIGRRDRLPDKLKAAIHEAEMKTQYGDKMHLRIALDYSGRDMLLAACENMLKDQQAITRDTMAHYLSRSDQSTEAVPDVDILIRTGGEKRVSDFLLWECAYAEMFFIETMWPDLNQAILEDILSDFCGRDRRFGGLNEIAVAVS